MLSPFPRLSVLLISEEDQPESRRCAVAALNAKRGDRASVVVTKLVPRLRQTFAKAGSAGCLCLKRLRKESVSREIPAHLKPNSLHSSYVRPKGRCGEAGRTLQ